MLRKSATQWVSVTSPGFIKSFARQRVLLLWRSSTATKMTDRFREVNEKGPGKDFPLGNSTIRNRSRGGENHIPVLRCRGLSAVSKARMGLFLFLSKPGELLVRRARLRRLLGSRPQLAPPAEGGSSCRRSFAYGALPLQTCCRACHKSAFRSSTCSSPTEKRTKLG